MNCKTAILPLVLFSSILLGQFPIELEPDESTDPYTFTARLDTEFLLTITASANTNWAQTYSESATLVVAMVYIRVGYNMMTMILKLMKQNLVRVIPSVA